MSSSKDDPIRSNQQEMDTVVIEDNPFLSAGFTQVPNAILRHPNLSDGAKLVYSMLLSYAWSDNSSFPGQERLGQDLQKDSRTIRRLLTELKEIGLIRVERRGLGKTNIYYLRTSFEADRTKMSGQERTKMSHLNRTKMSDKEYEGKEYSNKNTKYLSRGQSPNSQKEGEKSKGTYSHIERGTIGNERRSETKEGSRKGNSHPTPIGDIVQARLQNVQTVGQASGSQPARSAKSGKPQGHWKEAPLFIQAIIAEWYGPEMHDQALHSSITRAYRLYQYFFAACRDANAELRTEDIEDAFRMKLHDARQKAKKRTPTVWTKGTPEWPNGKPNRMPLFFACLEEVLGLKKHSPPN